jgi:RNA polymerase sigma-70 factor (ECF subfamily)
MIEGELIPHLFRTEYRRIVSVLCRHFGFEQVETAEDIASDTFLTAARSWGIEGIPGNPTAWLYAVAKNKSINHLRHATLFRTKISPELAKSDPVSPEDEIDMSPQSFIDSQLQMMFAVCHPAIPPEAQVALSLRILCGFGIEEIADAFMINRETINKRLFRAKEKLRKEKIGLALPGPSEMEERLDTVMTTIYLLFNEGYYSVNRDQPVNKDLCFEAIRLCYMLVENKETNTAPVNALMALMCFQASRLDARVNEKGELILYEDQDRSRWNADLISKGGYFLNCATRGKLISKYHLEAGIAYWNTQQQDTREKWENILQLYNRLLQIEYSPMAALNRTYALSKARGKEVAILEAKNINLGSNHFYFVLLGELYAGIDDHQSRAYFQQALSLSKTEADKQAIRKKIERV